MDYPIIGSILVAALVGLFLQMTWIVGVQDLVSSLTSDVATIMFADFGFRMAMGAILLFFVIPLLFGFHKKNSPLKEYGDHMRVQQGNSRTKTLLIAVLPVLGLMLLMLILALLSGIFSPDLTVLIDDYKWLVFFLALVPGIWEELAFRGLIQSNLEQRYSPRVSVLITAVLFGLFHFSNLVKDDIVSVIIVAIMATAFSIGWGYIVIKSNSVLPAIFIHYTTDVILYGPLFVDENLATDESLLLLLIGLIILFPLVCLIITKGLFRNSEKEE